MTEVVLDDGRRGFVKRAPGAADREVAALRWLAGRFPVPAVLAHDDDTIITEALPGAPATDPAHRLHPEGPVVAAGRLLGELHRLAPEGCPGPAGAGPLLARAEAAVARGEVGAGDLDPPYRRFGPARLLELARAGLATVPDAPAVVSHGGFVLGHVVLGRGVAGPGVASPGVVRAGGAAVVSWGRLGLAHAALDLATATASLLRWFGPEVLPAFVDAYGHPLPHPAALDAYALLAQLLP